MTEETVVNDETPEQPTPLEERVRELWENGVREKKAIASRLAMNVKRVRRILKKAGLSEPPPPTIDKLGPFRERIQTAVQAGLTPIRIFNDIRADGYAGGKTILREYIRTLDVPAKTARARFRRFETEPGDEIQADWTTHGCGSIAGRSSCAVKSRPMSRS